MTESGLGMTIPAYRNDVTREADVIEEILRVYGYNNIEFTEKLNASIATNLPVEDYFVQNKVGALLTGIGFHEMLANSLTNPKYNELTTSLNKDHTVEMLNPLSNELSVLRQSMLFGGLEALAYNINRKRNNIKLFEFGKTYHQYKERREENKHLSVLVSGQSHEDNWNVTSHKASFFY